MTNYKNYICLNLFDHSMSVPLIIFIVLSAVILLLFLVLKLKISAFISLLIIAIYVGILTGMPLSSILESIQNGMGSTLGFVAVVVGLGAIFGQILESSGGAETLAHHLLKKFGHKKASWAMTRKSQARARDAPAPAATPLTAAITGLGISTTAVITGPRP